MEMANKTRPGTHPWEAPLSQPSELCPSSALSPPHCPLICPYVDAVADGAQRRAEVTAPHPPLPQPPAGHGIADGSRLVQCDFPLVAGCNPCWLLLITFFSPSCLGMASRMSCSISRGGDEADRPGGARTLAALFGDRADTGSPPACRDLSHSPGTLQDDSSSAVTSAAPSALVVCPAGARGFVCTDFAWTISSTTLVPFPSPPFPTLFPCSGISEGQKQNWRESSALENRAQERKDTVGFCWLVLSWKKSAESYSGLCSSPRAMTLGRLLAPREAQHRDSTSQSCPGRLLCAQDRAWKVLGLLCPSDLQPWLLTRVGCR